MELITYPNVKEIQFNEYKIQVIYDYDTLSITNYNNWQQNKLVIMYFIIINI